MAWVSFWYQYAVGGLLFFVGMIFTVRQGAVGWTSGPKRRNLFMLVGGFFVMFFMHLFLMIMASAS